MRTRRLVVVDVNGAPLASLDLSGIANANTTATLTAVVEEQCDLGRWHQTQHVSLNQWGPDPCE